VSVDVRLHQIVYSPQTMAAVEPGYIVLDNTANPRPDWYEIWPIVQFLQDAALREDAFYGFFSPKFGRKTQLSHADVVAQVQAAAARDADVVLFSPQPDMGAFFLNVFEQGETFDAGLIDAGQAFLAHVGQPLNLRGMVMDSRQTVFSNYFVARPAFWRAWLALVQPLLAVCEDADSALGRQLTPPTTYPGQAQRKVFLAERLASLLLATQPQWRAHVADPFSMSWSASRFRDYPHEAVISDALKIAHRENGFPEYLRAFAALRARFTAQHQPIGRDVSEATLLSESAPAPAPAPVPPAMLAAPGSCPVVVISYNNHPFVEHTLAQLHQRGVRDIIVLDNASTWDQSQRWLDQLSGCTVLRNSANYGHLCWQRPEIMDRLPELFAVTDPDLLFSPSLPADFLKVLLRLALQLKAMKVGFALDLSDGEQMFSDPDYHRGQSIVDWEGRFWQQRVQHETLQLYLAQIDTTFHIFNKQGNPRVHLRVAGDYTAKHLPWYRHDPVFGPARMTEIYGHATNISTVAQLHMRHHAKATA